jgi:pimeloyl-ACP methyl ester carboxylesterase
MPTVHVNGIDVYFERSGEGRRLLFLNGSGATLETSALLIKPFRDRFDVVAHDQRGLGRTAQPPPPYSMADYAADAAALLDEVGWSSCAVFGVSFGGMVAQELAVTWPERVERLVLSCTSPGGPGLASFPLHELADLPADERIAAGVQLLDTRFTPEWLAEHDGDRGLAEMVAGRYDAPKSEAVQAGEAAQLEARRHHDVVDRLGRISCPTLVACGRYDGIAPMVNSQAIAERVPGAVLRAYEGGHAYFAQDAEALPDIVAFIDGADLASRP